MEIFKELNTRGHEQIAFFHDSHSGLKGIVAIHNTTLGPALGGCRMWQYKNEEEAIIDVLRLSKGMTYKASIAGLNLGGGKAVIIGDSKKDKTEKLFRSFGRFVEGLGGRYITAEDVGTNIHDMENVKIETSYVTGIAKSLGGSGDPSPVTAYGVYMGMKASAKYKWGSDNLSNKTILVQGVGHVGEHLLEYLSQEKVNLIINDIDQVKIERLSSKYEADISNGDDVYDLDIDIYSPCALGSTVNQDTISRLNCEIIAGAANNQLANEDRDGKLCSDKGILYAPDFLINAGGLINVYSEIKGYSREHAINQTRAIYDTTLEIFKKAELENITTNAAALAIAEQRIAAKKER